MRAVLAISVLVCACSVRNSIKTEVLERSDELQDRPEWVSIDQSSTQKDGKITFIGFAEANGTGISKSALLNVSDEKALSEPMRSLVSEFLDQNQVGEGIDTDVVSQRIISATRGWRPAMPSLVVSNRYYETAVTTFPDGSFKFETKAFSLSTINIQDYEKAKKQMMNKLNNSSEVQEILKEVGESQRQKVLNQ